MKVIFKPIRDFRKVHCVGLHSVAESERDVDAAMDSAERDDFKTVYLYVSDLSLVRYARDRVESYNECLIQNGTDA